MTVTHSHLDTGRQRARNVGRVTQTKNSVLGPVLISLGAVVVIALAWALYVTMTTGSDLDCATENAQRAQDDVPLLDCDD